MRDKTSTVVMEATSNTERSIIVLIGGFLSGDIFSSTMPRQDRVQVNILTAERISIQLIR